MVFGWLKRYFPRSLFGRALLILLFPVIGLQLIVGQVFIQRHFQKVTEQMAESVALEINFAVHLVEDADDAESAQAALDEISVNLELLLLLTPDMAFPTRNFRHFYDISGKSLISSLNDDISFPLRVDLRQDNNKRVAIWVDTSKGVLEVVLRRSRVAATNPYHLLVLMTSASIILVVISVGFLRVQIRPIRRLAEAAEAFGKGRHFPLHPDGSTEVRRASLAFMAMRNKLDRQIEQRTQMLSGVSHDLRTPLTRMKLAIELMDDSDDLEKDVAEMERMIDGFLAFAKDDFVEEGAPSDPMEFARDILDSMTFGDTDITLIISQKSSDITNVVLKPNAMRRAIRNLLENAQKYATKITFTVVLKNKFLEFWVEDNGKGIPKELRETALRPFERLDKSRNSDGSVGLGLSIAADIAHSHGGTLELSKSKTLGGLTAKITIPR